MSGSVQVDKQVVELDANTNSAAALMVLLGEDLASEIMSHLDQNEVQKLSAAITEVSGQESEYADQLTQLLDRHDFPNTPPALS